MTRHDYEDCRWAGSPNHTPPTPHCAICGESADHTNHPPADNSTEENPDNAESRSD